MQIFGGTSGRGVKREWGCRQRHVLAISVHGYVFENVREKTSIVCRLQTKTNKKAVLWQVNRTMPL